MNIKLFSLTNCLLISLISTPNLLIKQHNALNVSNLVKTNGDDVKNSVTKWNINSPYIVGHVIDNLGCSYMYDLRWINEGMPSGYDYTEAYKGFSVSGDPLTLDELQFDINKIDWSKLPKFVQDKKYYYADQWFHEVKSHAQKPLRIEADPNKIYSKQEISEYWWGDNYDRTHLKLPGTTYALGSTTYFVVRINMYLFADILADANNYLNAHNETDKDTYQSMLYWAIDNLSSPTGYRNQFDINLVHENDFIFIKAFSRMLIELVKNFTIDEIYNKYYISGDYTSGIGLTLIGTDYKLSKLTSTLTYIEYPTDFTPVAVWNYKCSQNS